MPFHGNLTSGLTAHIMPTASINVTHDTNLLRHLKGVHWFDRFKPRFPEK